MPTVIDSLRRLTGVKTGLKEGAVYFKGKMDDYPAQKAISRQAAYGQTFFTDVQRRAFFAKLNDGEITVPYRRRGAGGLAGKWSVNEQDGGMTQVVGNNADYAPLAYDANRQSRLLKMIGWRTIQEVLAAEKAAIERIIRNAIQRTISGS